MSNPIPPPPYDPMQVPEAYMVPMPPPLKPTSVMVIGIIGIVLGAMAVLCSPFGLLPIFIKSMGANNPTFDAVNSSSTLRLWLIASTIVNMLVGALLLTASIGSVMLKRWARSLMITYAWVAILNVIVGTIATFVLVLPLTLDAAKKSAGNSAAAATGAAIGGVVGALVGFLFALALPICVLIFFRKPNVVEAFNRGPSPPM